MKRVGIDLGAARIGVAASDDSGLLAFARQVLVRRAGRKDLAAISQIVAQEQAQEVVLGLPINADGTEGAKAQQARRFAARLEEHLGLPVYLVDERYSTIEALENLREAGFDERAARPRVDAEAARVILQRYLDRQGVSP